jgi:hypothetical protein
MGFVGAACLDRLLKAVDSRVEPKPMIHAEGSTVLKRLAAYGTLLREPRRALHARIAEALENQFAEVVESQLNCWHVIAPRPGSSRKPRGYGTGRVSDRWRVRR